MIWYVLKIYLDFPEITYKYFGHVYVNKHINKFYFANYIVFMLYYIYTS